MILRRIPLVSALVVLSTIMGRAALHAQEPAPPPAPAGESAPPAQEPAPPAPAGEAAPPAQEPAPPPPPAGEGARTQRQAADRTPPRLSFISGEVSFWRPGAEDWTRAQINTALAPGDALYAGAGANLELQIGARAFVRAGANTQLELENQEPDFLQLSVAAGHASVDLRNLKAGQTIELDTPGGAFTIEVSGYYRVDVTDDTTTFITRRGGHAMMTPASGEALGVAPSEEIVIQGTDKPSVETYVAPEVDAWDRWNYDRTDHLVEAISARYVPAGVYGIDALDHYGTWRVTANYGPVWVPQGMGPNWAPYSAGRWVWDPYYGWTWVDNAPWGWAPCHYGRWVNVTGYWAWAPGPIVATPVYAPALVAFFGGPHFGVSIGIGAPAVGWVALGWGEPVVPWWGRRGFVGVPWWGGWGGPRVVNNVVIQHTTVINVNNINAYQNMNVHNAMVAIREDRFGRGAGEHVRVPEKDLRGLEFLHGKVPVQPVAASLAPGVGHAAPRGAEARLRRPVVATRAPHDAAASLQAEGLNVPKQTAPAARIVPSPRGSSAAAAVGRPPFGQQHGMSERQRPPLPPQFGGPRQAQPRQAEPSRGATERARQSRPSAAAGTGAPAAPAPGAGQLPPRSPGAPNAAASEGAPRQAAPRQAAPRQAAPRQAAPRQAVPPQAAPPQVAPRQAAPRQAAPPQAAPRQVVPHEGAPGMAAPAAPPRPEQHAPAARREPPGRSLPGEPANRLYRPPAEMRGPHSRGAVPKQQREKNRQ